MRASETQSTPKTAQSERLSYFLMGGAETVALHRNETRGWESIRPLHTYAARAGIRPRIRPVDERQQARGKQPMLWPVALHRKLAQGVHRASTATKTAQAGVPVLLSAK
jgi:hypothetical protein